MNIVGAKKCYDGEWWDDMMAMPKPFLVAMLERANRRADKAEESAPTSHNNARDEILPGQCPACHGCGNVMVSHVNECSACNGTGKTSPVA